MLFSEDPWGTDADLLTSKSIAKPAEGLPQLLIRFHQKVLSPIDGPRSHYYPSSSAYTLASMQQYGFLKGFTMGCDRLLRENRDPWHYPLYQSGEYTLKWDPPQLYDE